MPGSARSSAPRRTAFDARVDIGDAELVAEARAGSVGAKELLFKRHVNMAFGMALRILGTRQEVEDLVHESFVEALDSLVKLREDAYFGTWLGRIVINRTLKFRRRERLRARLGLCRAEPVDLSQIVSNTAPPDVLVELETLYRLLDRLPENARVALIMRRVEGKKLDEIAELMGRSIGTVKRLLSYAESVFDQALGDTRRERGV